VLYRRIPPYADRVTWDEAGIPTASKLNFKDKDDEVSLHIAKETTPERILAGHDGFGLVSLTAGDVRRICRDPKTNEPVVFICRDERDPAEGHVLVCGIISGGMAKRMRDCAKWVEGKWPLRESS
jgi:hypothetical protein